MGSIYKRGKVYWIKYSYKGKTKRESSGSKKRKVAESMLKLLEGDIEQGKAPRIIYSKTTFDHLVALITTDYKINKNRSLDRLEFSIRHLREHFGNTPAIDVDSQLINSYIEKRHSEHAENATINREFAALKRMYKLGRANEPPLIDKIPAIKMLAEDNAREGFFEEEDLRRVIDYLPNPVNGMIIFAYTVGWRIGEVKRLTWDRVDLTRGTVRIGRRDTKNKMPKLIYLDPECLEIFKRQHAFQVPGCPYVFQRRGKQIKCIRGSWAAACKKVGVAGKLVHDLRRSGVREMRRAGIPESVVMQIAGLRTREMFDRYNIIDEGDLEDAAEARYRRKRPNRTASDRD